MAGLACIGICTIVGLALPHCLPSITNGRNNLQTRVIATEITFLCPQALERP